MSALLTKKKEKNGNAKEAERWGSPAVRPGKGWQRLRRPSLFTNSPLNSIRSPKFFFLFDPFLDSPLPPHPPTCRPAEPSPRLEPSSGNSNVFYQSSTFSKDPFFPVTSILSWNDLFSPKLQCRQTDGILAQRCIYDINYFICLIESVQNVLKSHNNQS